MRLRTGLGYLAALAVVVVVSFFSVQNRDLLDQSFRLGGERRLPLWMVAVLVFLLGFLPPASILIVQRLRSDLAERQARRSSRHEVSLDQVFRRALDYEQDTQLDKALAEFEAYLEARPEDFAALLHYGALLRRLNRVPEAIEVHRRAERIYPNSVAAIYQLIDDYEQGKQPEIAVELRNRILRDFPERGVQVRRWRRARAIARADWKSATQDQEEIDALLADGADESASPRDLAVRRGLVYQRGVTLLEVDRPADARVIFESLLREDPGFVPARIMLGEASLLLEDEDGALDEWEQGYEETGSPVFLQRIEDHFIDQEAPLRAIETLHALIGHRGQEILPRFFLGRLYYRLEMLDEAEKTLIKLHGRAGSSPTYHYLLGRIRERRGEMRLAAESYRNCARQAGIQSALFRCIDCSASYPDWQDRCEECGRWNSVELALEREQLEDVSSGRIEVPTWGGARQGTV